MNDADAWKGKAKGHSLSGWKESSFVCETVWFFFSVYHRQMCRNLPNGIKR